MAGNYYKKDSQRHTTKRLRVYLQISDIVFYVFFVKTRKIYFINIEHFNKQPHHKAHIITN